MYRKDGALREDITLFQVDNQFHFPSSRISYFILSAKIGSFNGHYSY